MVGLMAGRNEKRPERAVFIDVLAERRSASRSYLGFSPTLCCTAISGAIKHIEII